MGTSFDLGAQAYNQRAEENKRIAEQDRIARQAKMSAIVGDSLNALPLPKDENGNPDINNPVYNDIMQRRQKLIGSLMDEYTPVQHANVIQRIGGLITGNKQHAMPHPSQPLPAMGTGPAALAAQAGGEQAAQAQQDLDASAGNQIPQQPVQNLDLHPLAHAPAGHPLHAITAGIKNLSEGLKNHGQAFMHPDIKQPDQSELINGIAQSYVDPLQLKHERDMELYGLRGETAENVANIKAQNLRGTPYNAGAMSIDDAIKRAAATGEDFINSANGKPFDLDTVRQVLPGTKLVPIVQGKRTTGYLLADQKQRLMNWDNQQHVTGEFNIGTDSQIAGLKTVPTTTSNTSATTDPFNLTTTHTATTTRTPLTPVSTAAPTATPAAALTGPVSSAAPALPNSVAAVNQQALQSKLKKGVKSAPVSAAAPGAPTSAPLALDADGHIPAGVGNDLVRQFANGILDGRDPKEIGNPKVQGAALALVDKFVPNYSRGAFTPKEKIQFQVATDFLQQLKDSKALSVLDHYVSREKIASAMKAPEHMSFVDRIVAFNLNKEEAEFVRLFNAARGTVAGLSQITRSGRATNNQVTTIAQELPNVFQSSSSKDAKDRVDQLLKEADIALHTNPRDVGKGGPRSKSAPEVGEWKPPADAPAAPQADNKVLKDGSGTVIAKSQGGKWVQP